MGPSVTCYFQPEKPKSRQVLDAFAAGVTASGGLGRLEPVTVPQLDSGAAAFYGVRPSWKHLWRQALAEERDWYYLDNSWFDASRERYFRVGVNATQSWSPRPSDGTRLAALGVEVKPWRPDGRHIVVCPQSLEYLACVAGWAWGGQDWLKHVLHELKLNTDRRLIIRAKGGARPLAADLIGARALVTHSSAAAIEALLAGVPAIVTDRSCAAAPLAMMFADIEAATIPEPAGRHDWAARLADSQWNLTELRDGLAWRMLQQ